MFVVCTTNCCRTPLFLCRKEEQALYYKKELDKVIPLANEYYNSADIISNDFTAKINDGGLGELYWFRSAEQYIKYKLESHILFFKSEKKIIELKDFYLSEYNNLCKKKEEILNQEKAALKVEKDKFYQSLKDNKIDPKVLDYVHLHEGIGPFQIIKIPIMDFANFY